jgi:hypothetical protein
MRANRKNHKRIPRIHLNTETLLFLWRAFGVVPKVKTGIHRVAPLARVAIFPRHGRGPVQRQQGSRGGVSR